MLRERARRHLEHSLLRLWFTPPGAATPASTAARLALAPLGSMVGAMATRRRRRIHAAKIARGRSVVPGPVIVVIGNIVTGGTGKSPIVAALARALHGRGTRVGLVSRNYRASGRHAMAVTASSDPGVVGDEAVMLARETGLPVMAGPRRADALNLLLSEAPALDVVLCDDGLQHEPLPRHLELAVIDSRALGNGRCLPAGPLRESASMLATMDALIRNDGHARDDAESPDGPGRTWTMPAVPGVPVFGSRLVVEGFELLDGSARWTPAEFVQRCPAGTQIDAVAGIARPERFFETLDMIGLPASDLVRHALPDHASIDAQWLRRLPGRWIIVTAKDAVKCRSDGIDARRIVVLRMRAAVDERLINWIIDRLPDARPRD